MVTDRDSGGGQRRTRKARGAGEPAFESSLDRLEEIVELLEAGELPLEKSLTLFEEGVELSRRCNTRLDEAERRLEVLVRKTDGRDEADPLTEDEFLADGEDAGDDSD
jgi:exodeoxyribonuclease VII small subunit